MQKFLSHSSVLDNSTPASLQIEIAFDLPDGFHHHIIRRRKNGSLTMFRKAQHLQGTGKQRRDAPSEMQDL